MPDKGRLPQTPSQPVRRGEKRSGRSSQGALDRIVSKGEPLPKEGTLSLGRAEACSAMQRPFSREIVLRLIDWFEAE